MNLLEAALVDISSFLSEQRIAYMVIGGFANLHWGRPRLTEDLDITVQVPDSDLPGFVARLGKRYQLLADEPLRFAQETRVVPITTPASVRVDLILSGMLYEQQAIRRAVAVPVAGQEIRFCAAEDLILHKLASERARDAEDVEGVVARQGPRLDRAYLDPLVDQLSRGLERPAIREHYRLSLRKAGLADALAD